MNETMNNEPQQAQTTVENNAQKSGSMWDTIIKIVAILAAGALGFTVGHFHGKAKNKKKNDGFEEAK